MVSNDEIKEATNRLADTKALLFDAGEEELECREALKVAEEAILLKYADNPKELGGNEPARKARIAEITAIEKRALNAAESEKRKIQLKLDLAAMRWDALKWQIRNNEVNKEVI